MKLFLPLNPSDEELEFYAEEYVKRNVAETEQIIFEHFLQREMVIARRNLNYASIEVK